MTKKIRARGDDRTPRGPRKGMQRIISYINKQTRLQLISKSLGFVLVVGLVDLITGAELSVFIFYLVPVSVVAAYAGLGSGLVISFAAAFIWFLAEVIEAREYSHPFIPYWNMIARFGILSVVTVLQHILSKEKHFARTDFLTGLANRKAFFELADGELKRSKRYKASFSIAYFDIDDFKEVNDQQGHAAGDRLLCSVARVLRDNIRSVDIVARLGGDEFAVLLSQAGSKAAETVFGKLHRLLDDEMRRGKWPVTFSFGVLTFVQPPESSDSMIRMADELMYAAKQEGKNRIKTEVYGERPEK